MSAVQFAIAILLAASSPALAQTAGTPDYVPIGTMSPTDARLSSMTCQEMMDRTRARFESRTSGAAKTYARSEDYLANRAMESGHDELCKAHMRKVMGDLR